MITVVVCIGNSDDKLSQAKWSSFYCCVDYTMGSFAKKRHFTGCSNPTASHQNACWVVEVEESDMPLLKQDLAKLRQEFGQKSVALVAGATEFV